MTDNKTQDNEHSLDQYTVTNIHAYKHTCNNRSVFEIWTNVQYTCLNVTNSFNKIFHKSNQAGIYIVHVHLNKHGDMVTIWSWWHSPLITGSSGLSLHLLLSCCILRPCDTHPLPSVITHTCLKVLLLQHWIQFMDRFCYIRIQLGYKCVTNSGRSITLILYYKYYLI